MSKAYLVASLCVGLASGASATVSAELAFDQALAFARLSLLVIGVPALCVLWAALADARAEEFRTLAGRSSYVQRWVQTAAHACLLGCGTCLSLLAGTLVAWSHLVDPRFGPVPSAQLLPSIAALLLTGLGAMATSSFAAFASPLGSALIGGGTVVLQVAFTLTRGLPGISEWQLIWPGTAPAAAVGLNASRSPGEAFIAAVAVAGIALVAVARLTLGRSSHSKPARWAWGRPKASQSLRLTPVAVGCLLGVVLAAGLLPRTLARLPATVSPGLAYQHSQGKGPTDVSQSFLDEIRLSGPSEAQRFTRDGTSLGLTDRELSELGRASAGAALHLERLSQLRWAEVRALTAAGIIEICLQNLELGWRIYAINRGSCRWP